MFKPEIAIQVTNLLNVMMWANADDSKPYSRQNNVYGHCRNAVAAIVLHETGEDISNEDWNLGGNQTYLDDVISCVINRQQRLRDEERARRERANN